ncbi:MAG: hypothetical protein J0H57_19235, partial [Rhodospirillales bacterium]|nr:hypothetical protein [Rhodospirillales bacterium]
MFGTIASTGGSVSLLTGAQGTIAVDAEARISAAQGQRLTLQGDMMTLAGRLAAPGGIVEIAPSSALPIDLGGTTGLGLAPATLAAIDTRVLRLGAVTVDGTLATTATAIRIDAPLTLAGTEPEITPSLSAAT